MRKSRKKTAKKRTRKPPPGVDPWQPFPVLEPEEFLFAARVGDAAGTLQTPVENPSAKKFVVLDDNGEEALSFRMRDDPTTRFGLAVAGHFRNEERKMMAFMFRWFALMRLTDSPRMKEWAKADDEDPDATLIRETVLRVAARFPMSEGYVFDEEAFFAEVAREDEREDEAET